jgi:hypothetical protein
MINSANTPGLSARYIRDYHSVEQAEDQLQRQAMSVKVTPLDPYTDTDEVIDIRGYKQRA